MAQKLAYYSFNYLFIGVNDNCDKDIDNDETHDEHEHEEDDWGKYSIRVPHDAEVNLAWNILSEM